MNQYPFGMLMPERNNSTAAYRFGFNGKENDNDVKGPGKQQDYGFRIYDPRLSKFLSADPLIVQGQLYPELSPYQFASLNPIKYVDLDGLEAADIKYESGHSAQMVGKEGVDLAAYNAAFDNIIESAIIGIASEVAVGELFGAIGKYYSKSTVTSTAVKTVVKTEGKASQEVINAEKTASKTETKVTRIGKTNKGETRVNATQGEKRLDITKTRVKEYVPESRNPGTGERKVNFKKEGLPEGSELHPSGDPTKRTPTSDELKIINENTPKN